MKSTAVVRLKIAERDLFEGPRVTTTGGQLRARRRLGASFVRFRVLKTTGRHFVPPSCYEPVRNYALVVYRSESRVTRTTNM